MGSSPLVLPPAHRLHRRQVGSDFLALNKTWGQAGQGRLGWHTKTGLGR